MYHLLQEHLPCTLYKGIKGKAIFYDLRTFLHDCHELKGHCVFSEREPAVLRVEWRQMLAVEMLVSGLPFGFIRSDWPLCPTNVHNFKQVRRKLRR